ncbi:ComF family protein [Ideonella sp. 4Y16]|uniref:ComF family protein n=1 Tax=Ideonella alba TaxID=2824118 RepID=UPI001B3681E1|nr:ComF family protein [Ideonella alba]MBQ0945315.1 ComF family protein [Ideonella alba]
MPPPAALGTWLPAWRPAPPPQVCAVCGGWARGPACPDCLARFAAPRPRCGRCALPLPAGQPLCGRCQLSPPPFSRAVVALDYGFPWDRLVSRWKQSGDLALTGLFALLMRPVLSAEPPVDAVLPMPASPARLRERGYDQALLLARAVDARADGGLLRRWRDTPHQTGLDRAARQANLRGAFMLAPGRRAEVQGRHLALVDDVMTTGASVTEASRVLREAGAASVSLWLLARTPE